LEPFGAGPRALRVAAAADFLREADDFQAADEPERARAAYLDALQAAPGHSEILQELAELDLVSGERSESALSFLREVDLKMGENAPAGGASRLSLSLAAALSKTGRGQLAYEEEQRALRHEPDAVLAALLGCSIAERHTKEAEQRSFLDAAVGRAPFLRRPRQLRLEHSLRRGDLHTACADAEQLEASQSHTAGRAEICLRSGAEFLAHGHRAIAELWLVRALRLFPDDPEIMALLSECYEESGQTLRAAELLSALLRQLAGLLATSSDEVGETFSSLVRASAPVLARLALPLSVSDRLRLLDLETRSRLRLARALLKECDDVAGALALVSLIDTRSTVGAEARMLEAELHVRSGSCDRRDRAMARLLEAVEMGWVALQEREPQLRAMLLAAKADADPALLAFAARVLGDPQLGSQITE
jgi:tetratricopeptide (TPR) repeat protein